MSWVVVEGWPGVEVELEGGSWEVGCWEGKMEVACVSWAAGWVVDWESLVVRVVWVMVWESD